MIKITDYDLKGMLPIKRVPSHPRNSFYMRIVRSGSNTAPYLQRVHSTVHRGMFVNGFKAPDRFS